jgi:rhodanese-related sulfurtransferase
MNMGSVWKPRPAVCLSVAVALFGLIPPLIFAWTVFGRADISAPEAKRMLQNSSVALVTVDPSLAAKLPESGVWPFKSIMQTRDAAQVPADLRDKTILLICPGGIQSSRAAVHLRGIGVARVFSIHGGFQEWITQYNMRANITAPRLNSNSGNDIPFFRPAPRYEQAAAVLAFFGVKLIYSIVAAFLVILLWRETATDLAALRRSMFAFFIGEGFCFINVVVLGDHSLLFEHLHSMGMVVSFAYFFYALLEGLDSRLIHFSGESRCAAIGLCGTCFKHKDVPCGLRRMFLMSIPLLALTAALPFFSPFRDTAYNTLIFGFIYGYRHPLVQQVYELRYLPAAAIILLTICFFVLLAERRNVRLSKALLSVALGAMTFSFFRLLLVAVFIECQVWFAAWEETSELVYVVLAGGVFILFPKLAPFLGKILRMHSEEGPSECLK